ncbi:MAG: carbonic anhydrase [Bdellovibrionales bacterium]
MASQIPSASDVLNISEGMDYINSEYSQNPSLRTGQKPPVGVLCCADSRLPPEALYGVGPGKIFILRNIGNSAENSDALKAVIKDKNGALTEEDLVKLLEDGHQLLSKEAKHYFTYAVHLGVKEFKVLGHENCGCINNAYNCNCGKDHGHDHASGPENDIIKEMGNDKSFATSLISEEESPAYLSKLGLRISGDPVKDHIRAITIKHANFQRMLVSAFIKTLKKDYPINVSVDFLDLAADPSVLYSFSKETGCFYDASLKTPPSRHIPDPQNNPKHNS